MSKPKYTIAVTGLNATDNPGPGLAVIRALKDAASFDVNIIGLSYEALEPGTSFDIRWFVDSRVDASSVARYDLDLSTDDGATFQRVKQANGQFEEVGEGEDAGETAGGIQGDGVLEGFDLKAEVRVGDHAALGRAGRS